MNKICIFAGTTEGRRLAEFLDRQNTELTVCTATGYGGELLGEGNRLSISARRLSAEEIREMMEREHFDLVIDATHPYASEITRNIADACSLTGTACRRLLRQGSGSVPDAVIVPDVSAAAAFLNSVSGNILLTTGSKEIGKFAAVRDFSERVYARVLPLAASIEACTEAGLSPSHIIAMQGPFSEELNGALLRSINAAWMVTKDSGTAGGFAEKITAAEKLGVKTVIIGRPQEQTGMSEAEMYEFLCETFGFRQTPDVTVAGIGPGNTGSMTAEVHHAIDGADCLIGAGRMLRSAAHPGKTVFEAIAPEAIAKIIRSHPEFRSFAVLMSGDSGFFSGTKRLLPLLEGCKVSILPGVSSLSYLCAKTGMSWENILCVSLHGRDHAIIPEVRAHHKVFVLTGGENTVKSLCRKLCDAGLEGLKLTVGENLSYPEEKIASGSPTELKNQEFAPLSVVLIENEHPDAVVTHGLPDEVFERSTGSKGVIPMTKREIRSVALSALQLTKNAVCWDIGAGSGSVAIEMALQTKNGQIYAIEQDESAADLIRRNTERLGAENVTIIHGQAPDACSDLPTPTHVFIGGCSGFIGDVIRHLAARKADIRICASAVSLETVSELTALTDQYPFKETEVFMLQSARGKSAGSHRLMLGGNPVFLFSMHLSGEL